MITKTKKNLIGFEDYKKDSRVFRFNDINCPYKDIEEFLGQQATLSGKTTIDIFHFNERKKVKYRKRRATVKVVKRIVNTILNDFPIAHDYLTTSRANGIFNKKNTVEHLDESMCIGKLRKTKCYWHACGNRGQWYNGYDDDSKKSMIHSNSQKRYFFRERPYRFDKISPSEMQESKEYLDNIMLLLCEFDYFTDDDIPTSIDVFACPIESIIGVPNV